MKRLKDQEYVGLSGYGFGICEEDDMHYLLCGYIPLCFSGASEEIFLLSPTGDVVYSPDCGKFHETGENIHEIEVNWRNDSEKRTMEELLCSI